MAVAWDPFSLLQKMVTFGQAQKEPLLLEKIFLHLRGRDAAGSGAEDQGLALYLTPTRLYATQKDGMQGHTVSGHGPGPGFVYNPRPPQV